MTSSLLQIDLIGCGGCEQVLSLHSVVYVQGTACSWCCMFGVLSHYGCFAVGRIWRKCSCFAGLDSAFVSLSRGLDGGSVGSIPLEALANFGLACKGASFSFRMVRQALCQLRE